MSVAPSVQRRQWRRISTRGYFSHGRRRIERDDAKRGPSLGSRYYNDSIARDNVNRTPPPMTSVARNVNALSMTEWLIAASSSIALTIILQLPRSRSRVSISLGTPVFAVEVSHQWNIPEVEVCKVRVFPVHIGLACTRGLAESARFGHDGSSPVASGQVLEREPRRCAETWSRKQNTSHVSANAARKPNALFRSQSDKSWQTREHMPRSLAPISADMSPRSCQPRPVQ